MALATYGAVITAVREALDDGAGSLRTIAATRFSDALHEGVSEDELARRGVLSAKPFRVLLHNQRRHPASPPINASLNLIEFDLDVVISRTVGPLEQADADAMATLLALAAEDTDAVRQCLETPPNLDETAAGTSTNLCGGALRYARSLTPRVVHGGAPPAKAQRFETTHRFGGVIKVHQAIT